MALISSRLRAFEKNIVVRVCGGGDALSGMNYASRLADLG